MDMMIAPLRKYADFYGRATRTEFWMFFLFRVLLFIAFFIPFAVMAGFSNGGANDDPLALIAGFWLVLAGLTYLALFVPELAVTVRRLHDQDLSGWLVLLGLVPMGGFVVFVFMLLKGTDGTNRHGPDPRALTAHTASVFT
jgi:uncharacterized membrane protein YhaH (DUF805 family)